MPLYLVDAIGAFSISVANLIFWTLILPKQYHRPIVRSYFLWSLFITLWSFGYGMTLGGFYDYSTTLVWNKYCQAMATLIGPFYFKFSCSVVGVFEKYRKLFLVYLVIGIINAFFLLATPFYVQGLWSFDAYRYQPLGGPVYFLFTSYFVWCTLHGFVLAWKYYGLKQGIEKKHVQLFLWASGIGYGGGFTLFLQGYRIPIPTTGVYLILAYVIIIGYSVFKYRFMDIEVIIKKTLVFAGIVTAAVSTIALPLAIFQAVIGKAFGTPHPFILMAFGIATTVLIYRPVERFLVNVTDKYLFQKKINYRLLLREASEYLAHVDSLKQQSRNIVAFLLKKARIANASVYAFAAPDRSALVMKASRPVIKDENLKRITLSHPIIEHFYRRQEPIELHSLKDSCDNGVLRLEDYNEIATLMKSVRAEAAIPCYGGEANSKFDKKSARLKGVLFLGHQKSDEAYSEEELDVFFTLGQESSIAFENARLYDEAINRSIELAQINEELNKINKELKETQAALMEEKKRALLAGIGKSIAHEINNPLTPLAMNLYFVKGILDKMENLHQKCLVESGEKNRKEFSEALETAKRKLLEAEKGKERIKGIVQTLRDLVRKRTGEKKAVQLKIIVDSAIEEMKYQTYWETLSAPNIEVHIPMSLPFISGITHDLQGVFVNLIINALHAMENRATGKQITIEADVDEESADMIKIKFSDNGCGIPKELQEKVFEHGFTTKGNKGTGIGLFYCKDNIERVHHGIMSVKSEVGVGTCFTIKLPCYKKEVAS